MLPNLIPAPQSLEMLEGSFVLDGATAIACGDAPEVLRVGELLCEALAARGIALKCAASGGAGKPAKTMRLLLERNPALGSEGYRLEVSRQGVKLAANAAAGLFYGCQTFRQLLPAEVEGAAAIPCLVIEDKPRFPWRGVMLDVSRHWFPVAFVKKYIDAAASFKLNVFHWHLTDDQGWRIEIRKHPELAAMGAQRSETLVGHLREQPMRFDSQPYGGCYTQEQVREVVRYAAERHVTVVPEIEMPGHAQAAIAAYPDLGCTREAINVRTYWGISNYIYNAEEATFRFLEEVLSEVMELFPSEYIHLGGDEAHKEQWRASCRIEERMRELGVADVDGLQSYFIARMERFVNAQGRKIVGWDEILEGGLAPNAAVMSWRGAAGGIAAAKAGHPVVMSPYSHCYLDYYQAQDDEEPLAIGGLLPLEKVYEFDPIFPELSAEEGKFVLGGQCNLWTEYVASPEQAEYMTYPRLLALAEGVWSPKAGKQWQSFLARLRSLEPHLRAMGLNFARHALR